MLHNTESAAHRGVDYALCSIAQEVGKKIFGLNFTLSCIAQCRDSMQ
jgi:hypothetical protein